MNFVKCFQVNISTFIKLLAEKYGLGGREHEDDREGGRGSSSPYVSADA